MKAEKIIYAMNDIKDDYVAEYAEKSKPIKSKASHHFRTWGIVAACLALVIICTPTLIHIFNPSEIDDPKAGAQYEFSSYAELYSALPDGNIIANIPNSKDATISAYVICPEGTTDFTDYNNYSYLNVDVSYQDGTGVNIFCEVSSENTAKEEIDSKPLKYPPEEVNMTTVSNCDIYYLVYDNGTDNVNIAVFTVSDSLYEFSTTTFNQEEMIRYISDMLNK